MGLPRHFKWGVLESIEVKHYGTIEIKGWTKNDLPSISLDYDTEWSVYRTYRPDVEAVLKNGCFFTGFVMETIFKHNTWVQIEGSKFYLEGHTITPDYHDLLFSKRVYDRDDIYGFGPPVENIAVEIEKIIEKLDGSILDFGCGRGDIVNRLRKTGHESFGIEIDRPAIQQTMIGDVADYITLYDGNFPTAYENNEFDNLMCVEVLEHIPDYEAAVKEFSRVVKNKAIISVPDMSAIPRLCQHHVVPWHLLESTHVNFFTQNSLYELLIRHFDHVEFSKICPMNINGDTVFTNLLAVCRIITS